MQRFYLFFVLSKHKKECQLLIKYSPINKILIK